MTEKIIIDGVNVKDCKRRIGKNSYCRYFKRPCADNNFNCIWKQYERLKEENEKQKEQIKQLEDFIKSDGEIDHINHEYTYKLRKVLQEVKNIAKGVRGYLEVPAPRDIRFEMDRILNLITEVELLDQKESEEENA
jgi:hypothetical protein